MVIAYSTKNNCKFLVGTIFERGKKIAIHKQENGQAYSDMTFPFLQVTWDQLTQGLTRLSSQSVIWCLESFRKLRNSIKASPDQQKECKLRNRKQKEIIIHITHIILTHTIHMHGCMDIKLTHQQGFWRFYRISILIGSTSCLNIIHGTQTNSMYESPACIERLLNKTTVHKQWKQLKNTILTNNQWNWGCYLQFYTTL